MLKRLTCVLSSFERDRRVHRLKCRPRRSAMAVRDRRLPSIRSLAAGARARPTTRPAVAAGARARPSTRTAVASTSTPGARARVDRPIRTLAAGAHQEHPTIKAVQAGAQSFPSVTAVGAGELRLTAPAAMGCEISRMKTRKHHLSVMTLKRDAGEDAVTSRARRRTAKMMMGVRVCQRTR